MMAVALWWGFVITHPWFWVPMVLGILVVIALCAYLRLTDEQDPQHKASRPRTSRSRAGKARAARRGVVPPRLRRAAPATDDDRTLWWLRAIGGKHPRWIPFAIQARIAGLEVITSAAAMHAELAHDWQPAAQDGHALPPPSTDDLWPMSPPIDVPGAPAAAGDDGAAEVPEVPQKPPAETAAPPHVPGVPTGLPAGDGTPGPALTKEGSGTPPAVPSAGPGPTTWGRAHRALDDLEKADDQAYRDAVDTGTLPISDKDWPDLAEGQFVRCDQPWPGDDTLMSERDARKLRELLAAEHGRVA